MKNLLTTVLLVCFAWLSASAANPAYDSVGLVGTVLSVDKQIISNAFILVVHEPTGSRRTATADAAGKFVVSGLAVGGPYTVQITQPNYQPEIVRNMFLLEGQTANGTFFLHPVGKPAAARRSTNLATATANPSGPNPTASVRSKYPTTYIQQCQIIEPAVAASRTPPAAVAPASALSPARGTPYPVRKPAVRTIVSVIKGHYDTKTGDYIYETGAPTTIKLPNGQKLTGVGLNSTENLLHHFITDPTTQVDTVDLTRGWLNFDRVFFDSGKATLTKESMNQLRNIVTLLHSYPKARVKLGGYTDSTGTYKVNRQLSEARARTAWAALVEMGVSPARVEARGYGSNYAIGSNLTVEGRAMNRRLSVKVLTK